MQKQEKINGDLLCEICGGEIPLKELPDVEEQNIPKLICWKCCSQLISGLIEEELFCDVCDRPISLEELKEAEQLKKKYEIQQLLKDFVCVKCCTLQYEWVVTKLYSQMA